MDEEHAFYSPCPDSGSVYWSAPLGDPSSGEDSPFVTKFSTTGEKTVTVIWEDGECSDDAEFEVKVANIEYRIDSNNDGQLDYQTDDPIEDDPSLPGKFVMVNNDDDDEDDLIDYDDYQNSQEDDFVKLWMYVSDPIDLSIAKLNIEIYREGIPVGGFIRLWTKDGWEARNPQAVSMGGDYVAPGPYDPSQLELSNYDRSRFLFVEGAEASPSMAADRFVIKVDPDGDEGPAGYVYTDAVRVTAFCAEVLDAQAFSPNMQGGIDADPFQYVSNNYLRKGAFTDGSSVLILRMHPYDLPLTVEFNIQHNSDPAIPQIATAVGSLHQSSFPELPAPDVDNSGNIHLMYQADDLKLAYYRPPNNFLFGGTLLEQEITFTININGINVLDKPLKLVRPTIFLAHGVTSKPIAMSVLKNYLTDNGREARVLYFNWMTINTCGYDTVSQQIKPAILSELTYWRTEEKIAAIKVDWAGHSMGGVIAKWYASNLPPISVPRNYPNAPWINWPGPLYLRDDNFGTGDFRRLITIGSPLRGSEIADIVVATFSYWILLGKVILDDDLYGDACAVYDLGVMSKANQFLVTQHPQVSWYPIVGIAAPKLLGEELLPPFGYFLTTYALGELGFTNENSDAVVRDYSQVDGIFPPPPSLNYGLFNNLYHGEEPDSGLIADRIMRALDLLYPLPHLCWENPGYIYFNDGF
jgi:hypothetical protein